MADCAGVSCGPGKGRKEDAKVWSTSLKAVLASSEGCDEFIDFLEECRLDDELNAVKFWRQCNEIVGDCHKLKNSEPGAGSYNSYAITALISKASAIIIEYCDESLVNLDKEMICKLNESLKSENPDAIAMSFLNAKGAAHNLLKDIHSSFAEDLIQRYGLKK